MLKLFGQAPKVGLIIRATQNLDTHTHTCKEETKACDECLRVLQAPTKFTIALHVVQRAC